MLESLSGTDLKNLSTISTLLYNNHDNFQSTVLKLLADFFGFKNSVFVSTDNSHNVVNMTSYNIDPEFLQEYQESYRGKDFFVDYLFNFKANFSFPEYSINNLVPKGIISINDIIPYQDYEQTEYCDFLSKENLYYEITMNFFYDDGKHSICIFKGKDEEDFTKKERILLNYLYNVIHANFTKYLFAKKLTTEKNIMQGTIENLPFGYMVVDQNLQLVNYNNLALDYCIDMTGEVQLNNIMNKFVKEVLFDSSEEVETISSRVNKEIQKYSIDIIPKISFNVKNMVEKHYYIHIKESKKKMSEKTTKQYTSNNISELYYTYHLTKRELEIAALLCEGLNNDDISKKLFISVHTVKTHVENIYKKIEVNSRTAAIIKLSKIS